jgi:hypothetical protein
MQVYNGARSRECENEGSQKFSMDMVTKYMLHHPYRSGDPGLVTEYIFTYLMTLLQLQSTGTEVISWIGGNPPYILSVLLVILNTY